MTPPKVYQKKRKNVGSSSKTQPEPIPKKTKPIVSSIPPADQTQTTELPLAELQTDVNETVMQVVQELNEEGSEGDGINNEAGNDDEVETEGESEEDEDEPYDNFRFFSKRTQRNFEKYWCKRSVIVERGMNTSHFANEEFKLKQNFESRGWTKWAQFSGVAVVPIVQEFYANMREIKFEGKDCIVTRVRGVDFKIYPKDIRKFFGLKEVKDPEYPFSEDETLDKDSLARVLIGKDTAQWGHRMKLAKNRLSPKFNALHFLSCSQLFPILNTSEISYEKGLLLYAIDEGMKIELGRLIFDSITFLFKKKKGIASLPFAGFITKIVCKKGVVSELGEQVAKPLGLISASLTERSTSHKKGKGEATTAEFMEKMNNKWDEANVELGEIKAEQYWIREELKKQGKQIAAMEAKLDLILAAVSGNQPSLPQDI